MFDLNKFRQSVCFKNMFIPGVCCPIRNLDDLNTNNKFTGGFASRPGSVEPVGTNGKPILKPSSNRPSFHLTENPNYLDLVTESSTKLSVTTQTVFSPFKDYFTTEKKVFYFKTTTPASNALNEVVDSSAASNQQPPVSGVEKTQQECGIGGRDSRIVGGKESTPGQWPWMAAIFLHRPYRSPE